MKFNFPCPSSFIETLPFTLVESTEPLQIQWQLAVSTESFHRLPTKPTVFIIYTFTENVLTPELNY